MSDSDATTVEAYLEDHPRMIGVLFTILLALSQVGSAAANSGSATLGP